MDEVTHKKCIKCNQVKEKHLFSEHRRDCKRCKADEAKKRRDSLSPEELKQVQEKSLRYYHLNKERCQENHKKWLSDSQNKEKALIRHREYCKENRARENELRRIRKKVDLNCKIMDSLRARLGHAIRNQGTKKHKNTIDLIGCKIEELKRHIESLWLPGMSWGNYGFYGWHIDHIRPCASFDLTNPEQQKQCFHYTNLQPLWAKDNQRKGSKYPYIKQ